MKSQVRRLENLLKNEFSFESVQSCQTKHLHSCLEGCPLCGVPWVLQLQSVVCLGRGKNLVFCGSSRVKTS